MREVVERMKKPIQKGHFPKEIIHHKGKAAEQAIKLIDEAIETLKGLSEDKVDCLERQGDHIVVYGDESEQAIKLINGSKLTFRNSGDTLKGVGDAKKR